MSSELAEQIFEGDLTFNGVNGVTGEYSLRPMSSATLARIIKGKAELEDLKALLGEQEPPEGLTDEQKRLEEEEQKIHLAELRDKHKRKLELVDAPAKEGVDPTRLDQAGWAVVFPAKMDTRRRAAITEALKPLFDLRQEQAGEPLFRRFEGGNGYRPGERKDQFFQRQKPEIKRGPADPAQMPFYVLLVGNPEEIPYPFQYQLDVMRGVGRLDFGDDLDAYAKYAQSVVLAETGKVKLARRATLFGVANPGDKATQLSARYLVRPLYENLQKRDIEGEIKLRFDWQFDTFVGKNKATRAQLKRLLGGDPKQTPALLFTASHGMAFPLNHPRQTDYQGALLCQDWPGPGGGISRDYYFAGEDLENASVLGLIALFFACYGAGTPQLDQFAKQAFKARERIAPHGFVGTLPKRLLSQGALAVIGHVERAWGYSFVSPGGDVDNQAFVTALRKLLNGEPIGLATDPSFDMRYADMSSDLSANLEELEWNPDYISDYELAHMWTANNDARGYVVVGDPAVRIPFAMPDEDPSERPAVKPATIHPPQETLPPVSGGPGEVDYGLLDSASLKEARARLSNSVQGFAQKLGRILEQAVDDAATLEVSTYVSDDMTRVTRDFAGTTDLRAFTRIKTDGDTIVCVPKKMDAIDEALWAIHVSMVEQAQANRNEMLKTVVSAATGLLDALKVI
jgi:hypothetical protein